MSMTHHNQT
jgi:hypothetical protein